MLLSVLQASLLQQHRCSHLCSRQPGQGQARASRAGVPQHNQRPPDEKQCSTGLRKQAGVLLQSSCSLLCYMTERKELRCIPHCLRCFSPHRCAVRLTAVLTVLVHHRTVEGCHKVIKCGSGSVLFNDLEHDPCQPQKYSSCRMSSSSNSGSGHVNNSGADPCSPASQTAAADITQCKVQDLLAG